MHLSSFDSFLICICEIVDIPSLWSCAPCRILCFYGCTSCQPVLAQIVASFLAPSKISRNLDAFQLSRIEDLAFKKTSGCQTLIRRDTRYLSKSLLFCLRVVRRPTSFDNRSGLERIVYCYSSTLESLCGFGAGSTLNSCVSCCKLPPSTFLDVPYSQTASSRHEISMCHLPTQFLKTRHPPRHGESRAE